MSELNRILPALLDQRPLGKKQQKLLLDLTKRITKASSPERTAEDWFVLGAKAEMEEDWDEAEFCFSEAARVQDDFEAAYQRQALALLHLENYAASETAINKALELDEEFLQAYVTRAQLYSKMENFEKASADLDHVLSVDPEFVVASLEKASVLEAQEKYAEAAIHMDSILEQFPNEGDLYGKRALYHLFSSQPEKAIADLNKAARFQGASAVGDFNFALAYGTMEGKFKDALQRFERSFRKNPGVLKQYKDSAEEKDWARLSKKLQEIFEFQKNAVAATGAFYREQLLDLLEKHLRDSEII